MWGSGSEQKIDNLRLTLQKLDVIKTSTEEWINNLTAKKGEIKSNA